MEFEGKKDLVKIRLYRKGDLNFIYSTWLKGLYYGCDWFRMIPEDDFFKHYHAFLDQLFGRPDIQVQVCCLNDDDDVILGYSVFERDILHWVFVKGSWRKIGIAKDIIPTNIKTITHLTKLGRILKPKEWDFNPFKL